MDNDQIDTNDFAAHLASVKADANAKTAEAKRLADTVRTRALRAFDIVGRLNALGAERVVQIGAPHEVCGTQMFAINGKNHGTLLTFGAEGTVSAFCRISLRRIRERAKIDPIEAAVALGLRSWDLDCDCGFDDELERIREAVGAGEWAWIDDPAAVGLQKLAPALGIERKTVRLKLANLTPKKWWVCNTVSYLRDRE